KAASPCSGSTGTCADARSPARSRSLVPMARGSVASITVSNMARSFRAGSSSRSFLLATQHSIHVIEDGLVLRVVGVPRGLVPDLGVVLDPHDRDLLRRSEVRAQLLGDQHAAVGVERELGRVREEEPLRRALVGPRERRDLQTFEGFLKTGLVEQVQAAILAACQETEQVSSGVPPELFLETLGNEEPRLAVDAVRVDAV